MLMTNYDDQIAYDALNYVAFRKGKKMTSTSNNREHSFEQIFLSTIASEKTRFFISLFFFYGEKNK